MPALRLVRQDGPPSPAGPQEYARVPHAARESLSPRAHQVLGALLSFHRPGSDAIDPTDEDVAARIHGHPCRATVQSALAEIEAAGWIARTRRAGRRRITLLFELATGQKRAQVSGHACTTNQAPAPRILDMHAQDSGRPLKEGEKKESNKAPSPPVPSGGAGRATAETRTPAPTPTAAAPSPGEDVPPSPAELELWRDAIAEPGHPLGRFAFLVLEAHDPEFLRARGITGPPGARKKPAPGALAKVRPGPAGNPIPRTPL